MRPIILFDIDRTLFDTDKFYDLVHTTFLPLTNTSLPELTAAKKVYTSSLPARTDFLPAGYLRYLSLRFSAPLSILKRKYYQTPNFKKTVYSDVFPILKDLRSEYSLGVFSEGHLSYQKTKLRKMGIYNLFDPDLLFIHRRKLTPTVLKNLPPKTIIVDDKPEVIKQVYAANLTGILIDRRSKHHHADCITTLNQLPALLHRLSTGN